MPCIERCAEFLLSICYVSSSPHPPVIRVNRRACRFGRYKSPRRPHPPHRASQMSCHSPQVNAHTFAHPLLTQPRSPSPIVVRSTNRVTLRGSILAPSQRGQNGAPTMVLSLDCTAHDGKSALNITLSWALPPSASHLLFPQPLSSSAIVRSRSSSCLLLLL
jgi:hypothetical protein